jgi:hypothetical protein
MLRFLLPAFLGKIVLPGITADGGRFITGAVPASKGFSPVISALCVAAHDMNLHMAIPGFRCSKSGQYAESPRLDNPHYLSFASKLQFWERPIGHYFFAFP